MTALYAPRATAFAAQDRAIDAANIVAAAILTDEPREAAKLAVALALQSANAWGIIEDVVAELLRRDCAVES